MPRAEYSAGGGGPGELDAGPAPEGDADADVGDDEPPAAEQGDRADGGVGFATGGNNVRGKPK